jgi:acetoin utilization deacetylase AcuC-like enzyme
VHQGNGTAAIANGDTSIFTFSIHGVRNYPFRREFASDLDIDLADGTADDAYLEALSEGLKDLFGRFTPDLVIYLAGADPYLDDRLGRLKVSIEGLRRRDEIVFDACATRRLPVAIAMAGGYARKIEDTVVIHTNTVLAAKRFYTRQSAPVSVL